MSLKVTWTPWVWPKQLASHITDLQAMLASYLMLHIQVHVRGLFLPIRQQLSCFSYPSLPLQIYHLLPGFLLQILKSTQSQTCYSPTKTLYRPSVSWNNWQLFRLTWPPQLVSSHFLLPCLFLHLPISLSHSYHSSHMGWSIGVCPG